MRHTLGSTCSGSVLRFSNCGTGRLPRHVISHIGKNAVRENALLVYSLLLEPTLRPGESSIGLTERKQACPGFACVLSPYSFSPSADSLTTWHFYTLKVFILELYFSLTYYLFYCTLLIILHTFWKNIGNRWATSYRTTIADSFWWVFFSYLKTYMLSIFKNQIWRRMHWTIIWNFPSYKILDIACLYLSQKESANVCWVILWYIFDFIHISNEYY